MPSVRIDRPDDPRFKIAAAELQIDWRLVRSLLIDVWAHMTDAETWILKPTIIDAIAGTPRFHAALVSADLAELLLDGTVRIFDEDAPFGRIEWLGDMRSAKVRAGKARAANAIRDESGRMSSRAPADDQQEASTASSRAPAHPAIGIGVDLGSDLPTKICSPAAAGEPLERGGEESDRQEALPGAGPPPEKARPRFDFEALYRRYPLKKGRARGLRRCREQVRTASQFAALERAIEHYAAYQARPLDPKEFRPSAAHFSSFMAADVWPDWIEPDPAVLYGRRGAPAPPTAAAHSPPRSSPPPAPRVSLEQMEADLAQLEREKNPFIGKLRELVKLRRSQEHVDRGAT